MTTATQKATAAIAAASAVTALVGSRYWPDIAPPDPAKPYITFQVITQIRNDHLSGPGKGQRVRIQFNCYATTRAGADALADALEKHLSNTGRIVFRLATYETEAQLYWVQLDWSTPLPTPL